MGGLKRVNPTMTKSTVTARRKWDPQHYVERINPTPSARPWHLPKMCRIILHNLFEACFHYVYIIGGKCFLIIFAVLLMNVRPGALALQNLPNWIPSQQEQGFYALEDFVFIIVLFCVRSGALHYFLKRICITFCSMLTLCWSHFGSMLVWFL